MVKTVFLIFLSSLFLYANINTKVKNILGYEEYETHKNLINHIFKDKSSYYDKDNKIDYIKLSQTLKENNLLKLKLNKISFINATFNIEGNPKKTIFILKNILRSLGYYYFITSEAIKIDTNFKWSIKIKSKVAISPLKLSKALSLRNCKVLDIKKEGNKKWSYDINSMDSILYNVKDLQINNSLNLKKSLKPYMIVISNASNITITSKNGNRWHPKIVFYDNNLNIIEIFKENSLHESLRLEVPIDTRYIKINDIYTLANLKRGINITKE